MTILDEILAHKAVEVEAAKLLTSADEMRDRARSMLEPTRGFRAVLAGAEAPAVIAEVKRRSPSKGEIRADFEPVSCAQQYEANGAAVLSVLTDEHYFGGHLDDLVKIRAEVSLPLLRKDFTIDSYQVDEARASGADAILLIAKALAQEQLSALYDHARSLGLDVLVEVHNEAELKRAMAIEATLIGVNNRDLATFTTDLAVTERLAAVLFAGAGAGPDGDVLLVGESGIRDRADIARLEAVGARAFLVGESLMRESDLGLALRTLRTGVSA
ncbi:MAG: indole-3-glycerol phosphate synthase [Myxococcota bacterium]